MFSRIFINVSCKRISLQLFRQIQIFISQQEILIINRRKTNDHSIYYIERRGVIISEVRVSKIQARGYPENLRFLSAFGVTGWIPK